MALLFSGMLLMLLGCAQVKLPWEKAAPPAAAAPALQLSADKGDTVSVNYIGKLENGTLFDTSIEAEAKKAGIFQQGRAYQPLKFVVGAGQMIAGFDAAVDGMKIGEEKTVRLPPSQAYGERNDSNIISVPLESIQGASALEVGAILYTQGGAKGTVIAIKDGNATIDFNHELAGKALVFTITMVSIEKG